MISVAIDIQLTLLLKHYLSSTKGLIRIMFLYCRTTKPYRLNTELLLSRLTRTVTCINNYTNSFKYEPQVYYWHESQHFYFIFTGLYARLFYENQTLVPRVPFFTLRLRNLKNKIVAQCYLGKVCKAVDPSLPVVPDYFLIRL